MSVAEHVTREEWQQVQINHLRTVVTHLVYLQHDDPGAECALCRTARAIADVEVQRGTGHGETPRRTPQ